MTARPWQRCTRCVMDTTDPLIRFDESGVCNHCHEYTRLAREHLRSGPEREEALHRLVGEIRDAGRGREYDCIIGVSGGVDSSYVAWLTRHLGLRPLAVHLDNGWNSEAAVSNIERILKRLDIDLYTHVVDWEEFRDLHLAFLRASVPDGEIPTDHAILATLHHVAAEYGIRSIISGTNIVTEGVLPASWTYGIHDWRYIASIHAQYGTIPLRTFPRYTKAHFFYYKFVRRMRLVSILNHISYVKSEAMRKLENELGWRYYGGKHYESIYTRFFQGYILPTKFGIDKRKAHLSTLICSGQITRDTALEEIKQNPYLERQAAADREYVVKKLGITDAEFERILAQPIRSSWDFPTYRPIDRAYAHLAQTWRSLLEHSRRPLGRIPAEIRPPPIRGTRPLRIAYVTDIFSIHDTRFLQKLQEGPFDPTLIAFGASSPALEGFLRQFPRLRIRWHPFDIAPPARRPRFLGPLRRTRATWQAVAALRGDLHELHPDILHAGWVQTCGAVAALSGFHPLLLMPWGSDILLWPNRSRLEWRLAQFAIRSADAIACDAETVRQAIRRLCPVREERITVFPWGIDLSRFSPRSADRDLRRSWGFENAIVLIMTRSFEPVYGIDLFLRALSLLMERIPGVRAVLVGRGSLEHRLRELAQELGIASRVRFAGHVPNEELGRFLSSADLYVSSSHSDGTSLSLLEAMACGLPVVVSDLPANREWVVDGENGRLVPPGDPAALAHAIETLLRSPETLRAISERNLTLANHRADWNHNFEICAEIYRRLAGVPR